MNEFEKDLIEFDNNYTEISTDFIDGDLSIDISGTSTDEIHSSQKVIWEKDLSQNSLEIQDNTKPFRIVFKGVFVDE